MKLSVVLIISILLALCVGRVYMWRGRESFLSALKCQQEQVNT